MGHPPSSGRARRPSTRHRSPGCDVGGGGGGHSPVGLLGGSCASSSRSAAASAPLVCVPNCGFGRRQRSNMEPGDLRRGMRQGQGRGGGHLSGVGIVEAEHGGVERTAVHDAEYPCCVQQRRSEEPTQCGKPREKRTG